MNDDFLYRLRVDPPEDFASRLKTRLDAMDHASKRLLRWGLPLLIFGTAFALTLPQLRDRLAQLRAEAPAADETKIAAPARVAAPRVSAAIEEKVSPDSATPTEPDAHASPGTRSLPSDAKSALRSEESPNATHITLVRASDLAAVIGSVSGREERSTDAVPHSSTPEDEAYDALVLRQSVFRVLDEATRPLAEAFRERRPIEARVAQVSASRIAQLAPLIAEAFARDTRGFPLETEALDAVWARKEAFAQYIEELQVNAATVTYLGSEMKSDRMLRFVGRILRTCDECHKAYRSDDQVLRRAPRVGSASSGFSGQ